jgi:4'-phosphopantetheinyl transferase
VVDGNADVWLEDLFADAMEYGYYWSLLDACEQAKGERFLQAQHQRQYVISHGKLRLVLAGYLGLAPDKVRYSVTASGKPFIVCGQKPHELRFNLSHSGTKMLVAVGLQEYLGVDIEVWGGNADFATLAKHCFADTEYRYWSGLPVESQRSAFYRFWTRKESFIKAVGEGLAIELPKVVTSVAGEAGYVAIPVRYGLPENWRLKDLELGGNFSAALTVSGELASVRIKNNQLRL